MFKRLMLRLYGKPRSAPQKRTFRPTVELLETRITPTTFLWNSIPGAGLWETDNWTPILPGNILGRNTDGSYPGFNGTTRKATTDDIALFERFSSNVTMQKPHELASLNLTKDFGKTLTLQGKLTLDKGGSL